MRGAASLPRVRLGRASLAKGFEHGIGACRTWLRPGVRHEALVDSLCGEGHDRAVVEPRDAGLKLALIDGVGGVPGAGAAAERVMLGLKCGFEDLTDEDACVDLLLSLDEALYQDPKAGEAVALVAVVAAGIVWGASCGDCRLLLLPWGEEPTRYQRPQSRLGSGVVAPVPFRANLPPAGSLLAATDGVFGVVPCAEVCALTRRLDAEHIPNALARAVRVAGGTDDLAIVIGW